MFKLINIALIALIALIFSCPDSYSMEPKNTSIENDVAIAQVLFQMLNKKNEKPSTGKNNISKITYNKKASAKPRPQEASKKSVAALTYKKTQGQKMPVQNTKKALPNKKNAAPKPNLQVKSKKPALAISTVKKTAEQRKTATKTFAPFNVAGHPVLQLKARTQGANQCGSHAALNARAIQFLNEADLPITSQDVEKQNNSLSWAIRKHQLTYDEVRQVADQIGLKRTLIIAHNNGIRSNKKSKHFIEKDKSGERLNRFYIASYTADIEPISNSLEAFFAQIYLYLEALKARDFHVICNTSGHWVCISVIMQPKKCDIYYCDSANGALSQTSSSFKFVEFITKMVCSL